MRIYIYVYGGANISTNNFKFNRSWNTPLGGPLISARPYIYIFLLAKVNRAEL